MMIIHDYPPILWFFFAQVPNDAAIVKCPGIVDNWGLGKVHHWCPLKDGAP